MQSDHDLAYPNSVEIGKLSLQYKVVIERQADTLFSKIFSPSQRKTIEALSDVSLDIRAGNSYALIGGNGAGKSTLLKAIAGVLKPSAGEIRLWGRPHLLAPGMGFNRRLTGRENVLLGSLAAGMTTEEAREKQDSIVSFADIGGFIDMPTTTYSSGMFSRLAFSVATHVESEILLIDEALSAGDQDFREKAVARVKQLCHEAKTVIVVSHSSALVSELATRGIWLHRGSVEMTGEVRDVADSYLKFQATEHQTAQRDRSIADS